MATPGLMPARLDPARIDPRIERGRMVEAGGMRFDVDVSGAADAPRFALLLHGFPESSYSWRHQLPLLADLGFEAWAPNQRGYGATSRPEGVVNYRMERLLDDVGALIDVGARGRPVTLIGHDWGGAVAWMAALAALRPLERLVVMNLPHPTIFSRSLRGRRQLLRSWYMFFFQLPWLPERVLGARGARAIGEAFRGMALDKSRFPEEVLAVYRRQALQPGALTAMVNWYRGARLVGPRLRELTENPPLLDVPVLLLWGEHDTALGLELLEGTEQLVRDLTLRRLPGVSHWVQQEAPEAVNAMLSAWLCETPVPEADTGGRLR